jgi:hypothetical protein
MTRLPQTNDTYYTRTASRVTAPEKECSRPNSPLRNSYPSSLPKKFPDVVVQELQVRRIARRAGRVTPER